MTLFTNGPEYDARLQRPFVPPKATFREIRRAVPKELLRRNSWRAVGYVARDLFMSAMLIVLASTAESWVSGNLGQSGGLHFFSRTIVWSCYWWFQGLTWAGVFCLGHDAGHGTLFDKKWINDLVGLCLHTALLIPYHSWRTTHHAHHKATGSIERDENYVPHTRTHYKLTKRCSHAEYAEVFEETPIVTFFRMFVMQGMGWWLYLTFNTMGSRDHPNKSHWNPTSPLLRKCDKLLLITSNLGLLCMLSLLTYLGPSIVAKYYLLPYLLTNHWIVMFTFLHHSDPTVPHYKESVWSYSRGAAATVDRPLLGWMGRFFLHNISHDHIAHHFFPEAPFYNGPKITAILRKVLQDDYNFDSTASFYALYRSFTECVFVEDDEEIAFYKNRYGKAARQLATQVLDSTSGD